MERRKTMGSIYKRGSVFWIQYYRNGKPYRESAKTEKETEAKRLLKLREGEISQGKIPGIHFDKVRFNDLAVDFLADYRINERKSLKYAENSVKNLIAFFDTDRITDITTPRIQRYIEKRLKEGKLNSTINRELSALKRMLNLGLQQTPPKVDRVPHIPMLKENNVRKGFFEHTDFIALREVMPSYLKGFVTFAYKSGWRVSEIRDLTWSQVDLDNNIVRLESGETKNNEARTVYLDNELKEVFLNQKSRQRELAKISNYVFTGKNGTTKIFKLNYLWDKACYDSKIGKKLFHDFRRTAVRNMVRAGIPERVAMMISGHKTRSVFERYNIVSEADLKIASQKQETYLQAQTATCSATIEQIPTETNQTSLSKSLI
jgi:integrase